MGVLRQASDEQEPAASSEVADRQAFIPACQTLERPQHIPVCRPLGISTARVMDRLANESHRPVTEGEIRSPEMIARKALALHDLRRIIGGIDALLANSQQCQTGVRTTVIASRIAVQLREKLARLQLNAE